LVVGVGDKKEARHLTQIEREFEQRSPPASVDNSLRRWGPFKGADVSAGGPPPAVFTGGRGEKERCPLAGPSGAGPKGASEFSR